MPNAKKTVILVIMKNFTIKIIFLVLIFFSVLSETFADEQPAIIIPSGGALSGKVTETDASAPKKTSDAVKINNIVFDNADNIIFLQTTGIINENITFTKGYLKQPDRIYIDINNAILTTPKKNYQAKYSKINNVKISQFTLEPKTVRLVFEYNDKLDLSSFNIYKNKNSIFIKTSKKLVDNSRFSPVYSNSKASERSTFYMGTVFEKENPLTSDDITTIDSAPKNEITKDLTVKPQEEVKKTASKYYIDSIQNTKDGILIHGIGRLSIIPPFFLENPNRLIIDLDDSVVSPDLRNKTFSIGENSQEAVKNETLRLGQNSQSIARLVIEGLNAKSYRAIISPDSKSLYITKKENIITAKMADNNANLISSAYSNLKGIQLISFSFSDSVAFNVFEENSNLYLDINNVNMYDDNVLEPVLRALPNVTTTRVALDKLRITIPQNNNDNITRHISVKTSPDNDEIRIYTKLTGTNRRIVGSTLIPAIISKIKVPEITNLYTVVIDAGHGGEDVGATRENIYEKDITLKIAKLLEEKLKDKKVKTYMVRDKDKTVSLADRCEFSNKKEPDLFVSVHVNSSINESILGVETHWWKEDSKKYAQVVHNEMAKNVKKWKTVDRGLFKSQFYVINHTEAPAILCEIGFISHKKEREEIIKQKRQEEIAEAIADGIYNYLKARK